MILPNKILFENGKSTKHRVYVQHFLSLKWGHQPFVWVKFLEWTSNTKLGFSLLLFFTINHNNYNVVTYSPLGRKDV